MLVLALQLEWINISTNIGIRMDQHWIGVGLLLD